MSLTIPQAAAGKFPTEADHDVPLDAMAELTRPTMAAISTFHGAVLQNTAACQKEWMTFLNQRIAENMAMPARLANCRTFPEIGAVYADYWSRAMSQYQCEFQHMTSTALGHSGVLDMAVKPDGQLAQAEPATTRQDLH